MRSRISSSLLAVAVCAVATPLASAQISAIFSNVAGQTNNTVPTIGGNFAIGTTSSIAFDRPFLSPDGSRWIIRALSEAGNDDKDLVIIGAGTTAAGAATVAVEDSPTAFDPTRTYELIKPHMGITNTGLYAFGANLDGATADDELAVFFNGTSQSIAIREGLPSPIGGQNFGATLDAVHLLNDGTVRYRAVLAPATTKIILGSGATVVSETDVSIPADQLFAPDQTVDLFNVNHFRSSADGSHHIWAGDLNGATTTDGVVVVDGKVVIQEGAPLPGGVMGAFNALTPTTADLPVQMSPNGQHWAARVAINDGTGAANQTDVVLRNGLVAARTDGPIFTGATELWDDAPFTATFFMNAINDNGDMVIGGLINSGNVDKDAVLVYVANDGTGMVLAAEGDPVDLNGNGLFDDNVFIDVFGNDDGVLTNNGQFYFVASLQDPNNVSMGNAFLTIAVPEPGSLALLGIGALALAKRRRRD